MTTSSPVTGSVPDSRPVTTPRGSTDRVVRPFTPRSTASYWPSSPARPTRSVAAMRPADVADLLPRGPPQVAQQLAGVDPTRVRVVAHRLGDDGDTRVASRLLQQAERAALVDAGRDRDRLVRRAVEAGRGARRTAGAARPGPAPELPGRQAEHRRDPGDQVAALVVGGEQRAALDRHGGRRDVVHQRFPAGVEDAAADRGLHDLPGVDRRGGAQVVVALADLHLGQAAEQRPEQADDDADERPEPGLGASRSGGPGGPPPDGGGPAGRQDADPRRPSARPGRRGRRRRRRRSLMRAAGGSSPARPAAATAPAPPRART